MPDENEHIMGLRTMLGWYIEERRRLIWDALETRKMNGGDHGGMEANRIADVNQRIQALREALQDEISMSRPSGTTTSTAMIG